MNKAFNNFTWRNTPSIDSPLNATNLNKINNGLDTIDDRVVAMDTSKANVQDLLTDVVNVSYNTTTGVWTFIRRNGTTITFDQNVEKIPVSFSMSSQGVITMTTADGTSYTADIATLIKTYTFSNSTDVSFNTVTDSSGNKTITAYIVNGSITAEKLNPDYLAQIIVQVSTATSAANSALGSANNAAADALLAQSYAIGNSGVRSGEDTDNAKYYKEQATLQNTEAQQAKADTQQLKTDVQGLKSDVQTLKSDTQTIYNDTVEKYDDTVDIRNETAQLYADAEETINDLVHNAFEDSTPQFYVDLTDGCLYYEAIGTLAFEVDEDITSATQGDLLWEVS